MKTACKLTLTLCTAWFGLAALAEEQPRTSGQPNPGTWTITLRYGGGTPNDAGPMGHCTATLRADGHLKIESRGRRGVQGPMDVILYENDALAPSLVQTFSKAADAALDEKPLDRPGECSDCNFLILARSRAGRTSRVVHDELREFRDAPPAILEFVALVNGLLPATERVPVVSPPE